MARRFGRNGVDKKSIWVVAQSLVFDKPIGLKHHEGKTAVFTSDALAREYLDVEKLSGYSPVEMSDAESIMQLGFKYVINLPKREILPWPTTGEMIFHNFRDSAQAEHFHNVVKRIKGCTSRYSSGHVPQSELGLFRLQPPVVWVTNPSPEHVAEIQTLFLKSDGEFYY
jgi:hypothetical protein